MSFYDNFLQRSEISKVGKILVDRQNNFYINTIIKNTPKKNKNLSVLEIGPGKGYFAKKCKESGFKYTAIEANKELCQLLQKQGFKVIHKTVPPLCLLSKFDVIIMTHVLEHMPTASSALELLEQCKRKLNKKGLLIISTPDITYFKEDFFGCDYTHEFPLSLNTLKQIYFDLDLQIIFANVRVLTTNGLFIAKTFQLAVDFLYSLGFLNILFGEKAYKVKNLGHASCIVAGMKKNVMRN